MESKIRQTYRPRGHRWLVNVAQHKFVEFKPEEPTADGQWVTMRTFQWRPPDSRFLRCANAWLDTRPLRLGRQWSVADGGDVHHQ